MLALLSCRLMMQPSACRSSSAIVVENALKCARNSPDPLWKNPSKGKHTNEGDVRVQKNARTCARVCSVFFYSALARFARTETPCLNNKIIIRPKPALRTRRAHCSTCDDPRCRWVSIYMYTRFGPFGAAYGCGRGTANQLQERSVRTKPKGIQFILKNGALPHT